MQMATRLRNLLAVLFCILKGEMDMLDMYVALVIAGRRTCRPESVTATVKLVPARWREAVLADLEALGLDGDGKEIA